MTSTITPEAYERAASYALPLFGQRLAGGVGDGYWLSGERYFLTIATLDDRGRIVDRPWIVDAAGDAAPVLSEDALTGLLAAHDGSVDLGQARYEMPDADTLIVTVAGFAYRIALDGPALVEVATLDATPALYSPDGRHAAFLKDHTVWLRDRRDGASRQLLPDGERHNGYGTMQESSVMPLVAGKGMPQGLWSADSQWLVVQRIDERHLQEGGLVQHVPPGGERARPHRFKVSTPDQELPSVEFVACHVATGRLVTTAALPMPACSPYGAFAARECWFAGDRLYFFAWDRFTAEVSLVEMRLDDGAIRTVLREAAASGWVQTQPALGEQPLVRVLPELGALVWYSEADGSGHLYLHDLATGALRNRITQGEWLVREVVRVDVARRRIVFLASGFSDDDDLGRRHLCTIGLDGTGFGRWPVGDGDVGARPDPISGLHQANPHRPSYAPGGAAPDGGHVVVTVGDVDRATRTVLIDLETGGTIEVARSDVDAIWTAPKPRPFKVAAADGATRLNGALFVPTGFDPDRSYPLVVYIYPGPQASVFDRRLPTKAALFLQSIAELGAIGTILDTRGLPSRDRAFHQAGGGLMHEPQLADHVAAIDQLCRRHAFIDRNRIGMFGSSGGGYATARALFDYPDVFKVGVAVAGMHDSRNYVSYWIDRYGARPGEAGRIEQSNVAVAHRLRGDLLLIHGDMDDNVHPAHTLSIVDALIAADRDFDLLIVPNTGHYVILESGYAYRRMLDFFARRLIGAEPPPLPLRWSARDLGVALRAVAAVA